MNEKLALKFTQIYANLPLSTRQEVVAVVEGEPMSWNAVYLEIETKTIKGQQALDQLVGLNIIKE